MPVLSAILISILPTFGVIFIGWLCRRIGIWGKSAVANLNDYAYYIALPVLIFSAIVNIDLSAATLIESITVALFVLLAHAALFVLFALATLKTTIRAEIRATLPIVLTFGSTAYVGIPFVSYAFGNEGTALASLLSVALVVPLLLMSLLLLNKRAATRVARKTVRTLFELPLLWAVLIAIAWVAVRLPAPPDYLQSFLDVVGNSAGPTALLSIGSFLFAITAKDIPWGIAFGAALGKTIIPPIMVFALLTAFGITGVPLVVSVMLAATPTALSTFILANEAKSGTRVAAGTILVSLFTSLAALSTISALWFGTSLFG